MAAARGAAQGCSQRPVDHDGRFGPRRPQHLRRRDPDPGARPDRRQRPALHQPQLDGTLLAAAGGADQRPQPPRREIAAFNGVSIPVADQLKYFYDAWDTDQTYPHMAVGWTWAFDTPFKWTKQIASHFGGARQGMAISWPGHITDAGDIRNQFHHVIDVVPTILEATGSRRPTWSTASRRSQSRV